MRKETLGVIGAAVLSAGLLGTPATAAPAAPGTASAIVPAAAAQQKKEDLNVRIKVRVRAFGGQSRVGVTVRDRRRNPVGGHRVCLQMQQRGGFRPVGCADTNGSGEISWLVNPKRVYRVLIPATKTYRGYRSRAFPAHRDSDLRHR